MNLTALARLIEAADWGSFRELALRLLSLKGYRETVLVDGPGDGGTDFLVSELPPNPARLAIQVSVQKRWKRKLQQDAAKVQQQLRLNDLLYITSRRIPEAEFDDVRDKLWRTLGVRAFKLDNQAIASLFYSYNKSHEVLDILKVDLATSSQSPTLEPDASDEAAWAFALFAKPSKDFQSASIESAILTQLTASPQGIRRAYLERDVCNLLGLPIQRKPAVIAALDRMMQREDVHHSGGSIFPSDRLLDESKTLKKTRDHEYQILRNSVEACLEAHLERSLDPELTDTILEDLGGLLMASAHTTTEQISRPVANSRRQFLRTSIEERLQHFHGVLDSRGFPEGSQRDKLAEELIEIAAESAFGKHFVSGQVFLALASSDTSTLVRALGGHGRITVILDASVAIPMLAGRLYEPTDKRFFLASARLLEECRRHGLRPAITEDYLEEATVHLLDARRRYSPLVTEDPDLVGSDNAFVAHFMTLKLQGKVGSFEDYIEGYRYSKALDKADFYVARDAMKPQIRRLFARYGISTESISKVELSLKRQIEEALAYSARDLSLERPQILLDHDTNTILYLEHLSASRSDAIVLATWDRLHFSVYERMDPFWDAVNPAMLSDLFGIAWDRSDPRPVVSPLFVAKALSERAAEQGARVWDKLVRIEKENLHDAKLLSMAKEFKRQYLIQEQQGVTSMDLKAAWQDWKKHYNYSDSSEREVDEAIDRVEERSGSTQDPAT